MGTLIATLTGALLNAGLAIFAKLATEAFMQAILEKLILAGAKHAVKLTTNTVDDELVADLEKRLKTPSTK